MKSKIERILNTDGTSPSEEGVVFVFFAVCLAGVLGMVALCYETFLLLNQFNQAETDSRSGTFPSAVTYYESLTAANPSDAGTSAKVALKEYFEKSQSHKKGSGSAQLRFSHTGVDWETEPTPSTNQFLVSFEELDHKSGGLSSLIALGAGSKEVYSKSNISCSAQAYYNDALPERGLFPIVTR